MCWERLITLERPATSMVAASQRHPAQDPPPARRADAEVREAKKAEEVAAEPLIGIPA